MECLTFKIPGTPVPKARPRFGKGGGVYTPGRTKDYEKKGAIIAKIAAKKQKWQKTDEPVVVYMDIFGNKDGDIDNIAKSVLDSIVKSHAVIGDDDSVAGLVVTCPPSGKKKSGAVIVRVVLWDDDVAKRLLQDVIHGRAMSLLKEAAEELGNASAPDDRLISTIRAFIEKWGAI